MLQGRFDRTRRTSSMWCGSPAQGGRERMQVGRGAAGSRQHGGNRWGGGSRAGRVVGGEQGVRGGVGSGGLGGGGGEGGGLASRR